MVAAPPPSSAAARSVLLLLPRRCASYRQLVGGGLLYRPSPASSTCQGAVYRPPLSTAGLLRPNAAAYSHEEDAPSGSNTNIGGGAVPVLLLPHPRKPKGAPGKPKEGDGGKTHNAVRKAPPPPPPPGPPAQGTGGGGGRHN